MEFIMQQRRWKVSKQLQVHWAWQIAAGILGDRAHSLDQRKEQRNTSADLKDTWKLGKGCVWGGVFTFLCVHAWECECVYESVGVCVHVYMCVFMGFSRWC